MSDRLEPQHAARAFMDDHFPTALCAFMTSSVLRGEGTATSDLDLVIVADEPDLPYRESFHELGWPIETFVHSRQSLLAYFISDARRRRPSLPAMCAEGVVLADSAGIAAELQRHARDLLERGPEPLTPAEIASARYGVTDLLDDFVGCTSREEGVFIAHDLGAASADLILSLNRCWLGTGKWLHRALRRHDPTLAQELAGALLVYARSGDKNPLIAFAERALAPAGGRLFESYRAKGPP